MARIAENICEVGLRIRFYVWIICNSLINERPWGSWMKKLFVTSAIALAATIFVPAANAGGSHGAEDIAAEDFVRVRSTRLSYNIDHDTCKVTLKTTRNVRRITQRDAYGNIIKRWSSKKGERVRLFSDFSKFADGLTEGTLKVKTGYKNRVKFQEIGGQFRADLVDCLTKDRDVDPVTPVDPVEPPVMATCPAEVQTAIDEIFGAASDLDPVVVIDTANSCTAFFDDRSVGVFNGLSDDNGGVVGAAIDNTPFPLDASGLPGSLTLEEVDACAIAIGK